MALTLCAHIIVLAHTLGAYIAVLTHTLCTHIKVLAHIKFPWKSIDSKTKNLIIFVEYYKYFVEHRNITTNFYQIFIPKNFRRGHPYLLRLNIP